MPWRERPVLLTGGTGFVGSHLARRLVAAGARVHCLVRPSSSRSRLPPSSIAEVHDGSTEDAAAILARVRPAVVLHLAAHFVGQHGPSDVDALVGDNIRFTAQLLEAMARAGTGLLVNTGTAWQHQASNPDAPATLYAATKHAAEALLAYYVDAASLRAVTLKLHDTYGPDDPRAKLFTILATASARGTPLAMSPGEQLLELVHVDDVCDAYLIAGTRLVEGQVATSESYAIGAQRRYTLREVVELYTTITGRRVDVRWGGRPYRDREVMVPWRGPQLPGWSPRIGLADGIRTLSTT